MLTAVQSRLVEQLLVSESLRFGSFVTKSGRTSPYFFNFGQLSTGESLFRAAEAYAHVISTTFPGVECLYGPAYKGIPLAVMTSLALGRELNRPVGYAFNRKEAKAHGEGGVFVGAELRPGLRVVVIEDVLTGGTSLRETHSLLKARGITVEGIIVGIDRQERGAVAHLSARQEMEALYGCPIAAICTVSDILAGLSESDFLGKRWISPEQLQAARAYLREFGPH